MTANLVYGLVWMRQEWETVGSAIELMRWGNGRSIAVKPVGRWGEGEGPQKPYLVAFARASERSTTSAVPVGRLESDPSWDRELAGTVVLLGLPVAKPGWLLVED